MRDAKHSELALISREAGFRGLAYYLGIAWALFQLSLPRFVILDSLTVRAIHLAFAGALVLLTVSLSRKPIERRLWWDYLLACLIAVTSLYVVLDREGIAMRAGMPIPRDIGLSILLVLLVLEASRRVIGPALSVIAIGFTVYAFLGPRMPSVLAFRGVSLSKYLSQSVLSTEGIYGIPLDVSANTVFLFVLLGSMLEKSGAGLFYNNLAIALLGKYRGGPAKAAVVSSGLTGLVSGSSIANVVTTGTFTIPLMKKVGNPGEVAAATEVAASTNGQLMPPIMGAAAFIIAEYLGVPYLDVVKAAAIPALVSYFALFYITHLEASKLGMKGLPASEIPSLRHVLARGFYHLIPLGVLIYELVFMRHTPKLAAFNAIVVLVAIVVVRELVAFLKRMQGARQALCNIKQTLTAGMVSGSRNMLSVALATATAGIVVGIVNLGIGSLIVQIVEVIARGNIFALLSITAVASLVIGMGLPTTATYIVMASITVPVITKLASASGIAPIPAIAAHLFCFYFGILADDTPPVGLAAYAAAAIAGSNPIRTGIKGFSYDLRTAVIPFMFVFNAELVLFGVTSFAQAMLIFVMACLGAFAFTNAVQRWFLTRVRWFEIPIYLAAALLLFYPGLIPKAIGLTGASRYYMYPLGLGVYGLGYLIQRLRVTAQGQ